MGTEQNQSTPQTQPSQWAPEKRNLWRNILFIGTIIGGVIAVLYAWHLPPFNWANVKTNNAYVRGNVTLTSPKVSGYVEKVLVSDYANVKAGQPLVQIEQVNYQAQVDQAKASLASQQAELEKIKQQRQSTLANVQVQEANIESAQATLYNAQVEMKRQIALLKTQSTSQQAYDTAQATLKRAQASLNQAKAQKVVAEQDVMNVDVSEKSVLAAISNAQASLVIAEENLANTVIKSPADGKLGQINVKQGQYVSAGSALIYLVPPEHWVIANLKETDMANVQIGQQASVAVDALNGKKFNGRITEISPATGSEFSLNRSDNSTGNFVKIAQRIPVKIELDQDQAELDRLMPGMSVVVEIKEK